MKASSITILFFLTQLFSGCSISSRDITNYKNRFTAHKNEFESLIKLLEAQHLPVGYSINENELPATIRSLLENLDISDINISLSQCNDSVQYQLTSSWTTNATLYFTKDKCNKEQTVIGYHSKLSEMIEVWGMDDGWIMMIDYDFV